MDKKSKILICGTHAVLNKAFLRVLKAGNFISAVCPDVVSLDLLSWHSVKSFFNDYRPDIVVFTGLASGGISRNMSYPADLMYENIISQAIVLDAAKKYKVKKLTYFASSCVYPKDVPQPIKEEFLLTGALEATSEPYAISKIAGIRMCQAYNNQYRTNFISIVPATIYGPEDDFNPDTCHVIQALLAKIYRAKQDSKKIVTIWGTGKPRREFIFADDLADAAIFLLENYSENMHINAGSSADYSINELAGMISKEIDFKGRIKFDTAMPDGVYQKLLDSTKINSLGWKPKVNLAEGINITHRWLKKNGI